MAIHSGTGFGIGQGVMMVLEIVTTGGSNRVKLVIGQRSTSGRLLPKGRKNGRTVGGLLKGYRRSGSQDSPSEELYGIVVVTQFLDDEDELSLDVFLGCSLLTGKPLIFTKTKSFIND